MTEETLSLEITIVQPDNLNIDDGSCMVKYCRDKSKISIEDVGWFCTNHAIIIQFLLKIGMSTRKKI